MRCVCVSVYVSIFERNCDKKAVQNVWRVEIVMLMLPAMTTKIIIFLIRLYRRACEEWRMYASVLVVVVIIGGSGADVADC